MNLKDFYEAVGGDYEEVKSRLITDERILKYLNKLSSTGDYESLQKSLSENNWEDAFRFSHNLKGICLNLGIMSLFNPSSNLCENLRGGSPKEDCGPMMEAVTEEFQKTLDLLNGLE